jgi:hypothetical protein
MAPGLLPPDVLRPLLRIVGLGAAHLCGLPVNVRVAIAAAILASLGAAIVHTLLCGAACGGSSRPGRTALPLRFGSRRRCHSG